MRGEEQILGDPFMADALIEYTCENSFGVIGAYHLLGKQISIYCPPMEIRSSACCDISRRIIDCNNLLLATDKG